MVTLVPLLAVCFFCGSCSAIKYNDNLQQATNSRDGGYGYGHDSGYGDNDHKGSGYGGGGYGSDHGWYPSTHEGYGYGKKPDTNIYSIHHIYKPAPVKDKGLFGSDKLGLATLLAGLVPVAALAALLPILFGGGAQIQTTGRRRRRDMYSRPTRNNSLLMNQMHMMSAYTSMLQEDDDEDMQNDIVANYLRCSGMVDKSNGCIQHAVCQAADPKTSLARMEREMLNIVVRTLLSNPMLPHEFKQRITYAAIKGRNHPLGCRQFTCKQGAHVNKFYKARRKKLKYKGEANNRP